MGDRRTTRGFTLPRAVRLPRLVGAPVGIPPRAALLLCWLRHATLFLDPDGDRDNRYWLRSNVDKVLLHV